MKFLMGVGLVATLAVGCGGSELETEEPSAQQSEQVPGDTRESLANSCTYKGMTPLAYGCRPASPSCPSGWSYYTYSKVYRCCEAGICYDEYDNHLVELYTCC
ncbi:hypothetical protein [Hyalangium versicolor]|uniref:hypothetical protein n=1 Tax=Hyalangium versicolor TaxID=2861190 RepID=UPI001CCE2F98|nr:hypothetical protein [Hyalangium versicolor]